MAAKGISSVKLRKKSRGFAAALASAFLEWMLIFMLYVDAIFSYFVTSFARCCKLQVPCLLCSRLDHVLGNEKQGYYRNLVCGAHKKEISSLVLCHAHNELVDIHGLCETCLFSFATINKSNAETYRLLVAKLGEKYVIGDDDLLFEGHNHGSSSPRNCSCCRRLWVPRRVSQKLFTSKSIDSEPSELNLPVPGSVEHGWSEQKKRMDRQAGSFKLVNNEDDLLSHVVYTELKITSDTESEVHISEDDEAHSLVRKDKSPQKDSILQYEESEPQSITIANGIASEKLIHVTAEPEPEPEPKPSPLVSTTIQSVLNTSHDSILEKSTIAMGHGLEELKWQNIECKENPSQTEFIPFVHPSSGIPENPIQESTNTFECASATVEDGQTCTPVIEEVPTEKSRSTAVIGRVVEENSDSQMQMPVESSDGSTAAIEEVNQGKIQPTMTTGMSLEVKRETGPQIPGNLELGDAYNIAIGITGRQVSGLSGEQRTLSNSTRVGDLFGELRSMSNCTRVSEDLKVLLSQLSRGIEFPSFDMSPRVSRNTEELKPADAADSGMHILQKRASLERNESGLESLDGSIVSEIEGESLVERLKRQIEHDKKLLSCLYKELEEERNASAIAANQAMAMITKLQEEKASLHMDASQYLRMMEEQAEYDMEALQRANDDLVDKEKEIQDLEAELEFYRMKYPDECMSENMLEPITEERDIRIDHSGASCIEDKNVTTNLVTDTVILSHKFGKISTLSEDKIRTPTNSFSKSEVARLSRPLSPKKLAEKLHLHSGKQLELGYANGECANHDEEKGIHLKELNGKCDCQEINITENKLAKQGDASQPEVRSSSQETTYPSSESSQSICKETHAITTGKEVPDSDGSSKESHVDHSPIENSINLQKHENEEIPESLESKAVTE